MASIISAGTSTGTALNLTGDTSGVLALASNNGTVGATLDVAQNFGIGTTTPYRQLQVGNYSGSATMALASSPSSGTGTLCFASADTAPGRYVGTIGYTHSSNVMAFTTNATEQLRIEANGYLTLNSATSRINGGTTSGRMIMANSDTTCYAIAYGSAYSGSASQFVVVAGTSKVTTFNENGNLVLNGGTTSASGVGITFPATQSASSDANCLDDYEEGNWTPTLATDGSAATFTYVVQTGTYTKIGRMVTVYGRIQTTAKSGGTGNLCITSLPFNLIGQGGAGSIGYVSAFTYGAGYTQINLYYNAANATSLFFSRSGTGLSADNIPIANYGTGTADVTFSATYMTT